MPGRHFPQLVLAYLLQRLLVRRCVVLDRNLRGHSAHRMNPAAMAGLDQQLDIRFQEMLVHGHVRAVRQHEIRAVPELLDEAEDVVPAAAVQPRRMVAQFVQDLVHLERGENRLDQHGGADGALRNAEFILR